MLKPNGCKSPYKISFGLGGAGEVRHEKRGSYGNVHIKRDMYVLTWHRQKNVAKEEEEPQTKEVVGEWLHNTHKSNEMKLEANKQMAMQLMLL
jgi:hypothetical protein